LGKDIESTIYYTIWSIQITSKSEYKFAQCKT